MPQSDLDRLIDQLLENKDNPGGQRAVIGQMVRLGDPNAIVEIADIYHNPETEPGVRRAAEGALRAFRRMEQRIIHGQTGSRFSPELLEKVRMGLIVLLVLTALGNVGLLAIHALPKAAPPAQVIPTARDVLTAAIKTRIDNTRSDATYLRQRWQDVQAHGKLTCPGKFSAVDKVDMAPVDLRTYPDLKALNEDLNQATQQMILSRNNWSGVCVKPDDAANVAQFAGSNGAAGQITQVDGVLNALNTVQTEFDQWVKSPAPTVGPTPTPITPTSIPPTITLTPTTGPTLTPSLIPTVATITPTPIQVLTFGGVGLNTLTSYVYKLTVNYAGQQGNGGQFTGSLVVGVQRTAKFNGAQARAQYDVSVDDTTRLLQPLNPLYLKGVSRYVVVGANYYTLPIFPPADVACRTSSATAALLNGLDSVQPDNFLLKASVGTLKRVTPDETINGVLAQHYHADSTAGSAKNPITATFDVYLSADKQIPVEVVYAVNGAYAGLAGIPAGDHLTQYSVQYDLTQINPTLAIAKPNVCS